LVKNLLFNKKGCILYSIIETIKKLEMNSTKRKPARTKRKPAPAKKKSGSKMGGGKFGGGGASRKY